jgi:hypothetical protein
MLWRRPWLSSKTHPRSSHKWTTHHTIRSDINRIRMFSLATPSSRFLSQSLLRVFDLSSFHLLGSSIKREHHKPSLGDIKHSVNNFKMRKLPSILLEHSYLSCTQNQLCRGHLWALKHINHKPRSFSLISRYTTTLADTMNYYSITHRRTDIPKKVC